MCFRNTEGAVALHGPKRSIREKTGRASAAPTWTKVTCTNTWILIRGVKYRKAHVVREPLQPHVPTGSHRLRSESVSRTQMGQRQAASPETVL